MAKKERLDELSKNTLSSYVKQAQRDTFDHALAAGKTKSKKKYNKHMDKLNNREFGTRRAVNRLQGKFTSPKNQFREYTAEEREMDEGKTYNSDEKSKKKASKDFRDNRKKSHEMEIEESAGDEFSGAKISDLITHAIDQKPLEFQDAFNDLLAARIADGVEEMKMDLASNMFAPVEEEVELTEEEIEECESFLEETEDMDDEEFNEAVEQLDELSKETLSRYINKATNNLRTKVDEGKTYRSDEKSKKKASKDFRKSRKQSHEMEDHDND